MSSLESSNIRVVAKAKLSTMFGEFIIKGFQRNGEQSITLSRGTLKNRKNVLTRIQSSCLFGESFHATGCDCSWQVTTSLREISQKGHGIFIYLFQEGRGIGVFQKIKAFNIQQKYNIDTFEAFKKLGARFEQGDIRTYDFAADIIKFEKIRSVDLLTNNSKKVDALVLQGIPTKRIPLELEESDFKKLTTHMNEEDIRQLVDYLETKRKKLGQLIVTEFASKFLQELDARSKKK